MFSGKVFSYAFGLVLIALGIAGYVFNIVPESPNKELFAILFVGYGIWRLYRAYKM